MYLETLIDLYRTPLKTDDLLEVDLVRRLVHILISQTLTVFLSVHGLGLSYVQTLTPNGGLNSVLVQVKIDFHVLVLSRHRREYFGHVMARPELLLYGFIT